MNRTSRTILTKAAEVLNQHVAQRTPVGEELRSGTQAARGMVQTINEILGGIAEGGALVCATEVDGTLLGFVPRVDITLPEVFSTTKTVTEVIQPAHPSFEDENPDETAELPKV